MISTNINANMFSTTYTSIKPINPINGDVWFCQTDRKFFFFSDGEWFEFKVNTKFEDESRNKTRKDKIKRIF
jgi:hypothetical protein